MTAELLDKNKVIIAFQNAENQVYYNINYSSPSYTNNPIIDGLHDGLKQLIIDESSKIIKDVMSSFIANLTNELEKCSPDKYPCALCHENDTFIETSV